MVTDAEGKNRIIFTNYLSDILKEPEAEKYNSKLFF